MSADQNMDHEIGIMQTFAALNDQEQHVVKLYHHGYIEQVYHPRQIGQVYYEGYTVSKKAYTMELGEQTLANYFKHNRAELTAAGIKKVAADIAHAVRAFHTGNE
jgi:hypothetical protein